MKEKLKVAISLGDINGVGIEIILKSLQNKQILDFFTPVIFGSVKVLNYHVKALKLPPLNLNGIRSADGAINGKINVVNLWRDLPKMDLGKSTEIGGQFSFESLQAATKSVSEGHCNVLVTAPINKKNIQSDSFKFPGHTEYLAESWKGDSLMFLVSENLRVGLVTQHVALKDVNAKITENNIVKKVKQIQKSLIEDFGINKPKIAVLGLNPHAGDEGIIGKEEQEVIKPTIKKLFDSGIFCFGPYSADSFFNCDNLKNFDAVLAMYHDQGLTPFKTLNFGNGVNFTAGLPFVRTSPDHGVAYDITGKGIADHCSFLQAIYTAIDIEEKRKEFKELTENPLKIEGNSNTKEDETGKTKS